MRPAILIAALVLLGACSPLCSSAPAATAAGWKLTFTGPAAGTLSTGTSSCQAFTASKHFQYGLNSQLNGKDLILTITVYSNFTGQGSYKVGTVLDGSAELRLQAGDYEGSTTTGAGTLDVNADSKSGKVESDLPQGEHVSGTWSCGKYETSNT